jgi:hypothetical protein
MFHTIEGKLRRPLLASAMVLCAASAVSAQTTTPSTGLGQAWPNAADVSANPHWHVYTFRLHGIKYVQINDLNGTVHAAIGTANGTTIVLPAGVDAPNVTTAAAPVSSAAQVVYQDATTTITATPQSSGATSFSVLSAASCPQVGCSGPGLASGVQ